MFSGDRFTNVVPYDTAPLSSYLRATFAEQGTIFFPRVISTEKKEPSLMGVRISFSGREMSMPPGLMSSILALWRIGAVPGVSLKKYPVRLSSYARTREKSHT